MSDVNLIKAIDLIDDFCMKEYGEPASYSDFNNIPIAHTTDEDGNEIQVSVNLADFEIIYEHEGKEPYIDSFKDLEELITTQLVFLAFDDLVSTY